MAHQVVEMNCPGCGVRVSVGQKICEYCGGVITITTFNSVYSMPIAQINKYASCYRNALADDPTNKKLNNSIAMCYLKLKLYDKALSAFENAIEDNFDNSETYFYAAVCLLKGQKAFVQQRSIIDKALEYINAAIAIEPRGIYYYFLAYIKYDYFERKYLNVYPNYLETLQTANSIGASELDISILFDLLSVQKPSVL